MLSAGPRYRLCNVYPPSNIHLFVVYFPFNIGTVSDVTIPGACNSDYLLIAFAKTFLRV